MPKPLPLALAVVAALTLAALAYRAWSPAEAELTPTGAVGVSAPDAPRPDLRAHSAGAATAPDAVTVTDAMGLQLDAARLFQLGFAGGLVIDTDTRAAIEAVLSSMPADPSDEDLKRLEKTLRAGLPYEEAERAIKLFKDYRGYTRDVTEQMQPKGIPGNLQEARAFFDEVEALKRRHFGEATANALFGPHDGYARLAMEAMFIAQDATLTPEQKKAQLDEMRAKLPPDQRVNIPPYPPVAASEPAS